MSTFRVGQSVTIDHPRYSGAGVFTIVKVNRVNMVVENQNRQRVRCHPSFLRPVAAGTKVPPVRRPSRTYVVGEVVKVKNRGDKYVVIGVNAKTISVALLGGDSGHYVRCTPSLLTPLPV